MNFFFDICKIKKKIFEISYKNLIEGLNVLNMVLLCYINEVFFCFFFLLMIGCGIINRCLWIEWVEYK